MAEPEPSGAAGDGLGQRFLPGPAVPLLRRRDTVMTIAVGQQAPSFRLPSGQGGHIGLDDYRRRRTTLGRPNRSSASCPRSWPTTTWGSSSSIGAALSAMCCRPPSGARSRATTRSPANSSSAPAESERSDPIAQRTLGPSARRACADRPESFLDVVDDPKVEIRVPGKTEYFVLRIWRGAVR